MDDSDLSFASILLGFRKKDDKPQVDLENAATAKRKLGAPILHEKAAYEELPLAPYMDSMFTAQQRQSEGSRMSMQAANDFRRQQGYHNAYMGGASSQGSGSEQRREFHDHQLQKLARGRYKCSRCGALKTNHDCLMVEQLEGSSSTQVERMILSREEFYSSEEKSHSPSHPSRSSETFLADSGSNDQQNRTVRTITVRVRRPSLSASPYIYPPVPLSNPHFLSLPIPIPSLSSSSLIVSHAKAHNICSTGIPMSWNTNESRTKKDESSEETKSIYNFDAENNNNLFSNINGKIYFHSFLNSENKKVKYESL